MKRFVGVCRRELHHHLLTTWRCIPILLLMEHLPEELNPIIVFNDKVEKAFYYVEALNEWAIGH